MESPYLAAPNVHVLASSQEAPGFGVLPVNAFLIRDDSPVLVDTGLPTEGDDFLATLWSLVEPDELDWIFLTHDDRDHAGNLLPVLEAAPQARLVMNFVALSKLSEEWSLPLDRVTVVNPGQRFDTGARQLAVLRPPIYDSPGTVGLYDAETGVAFTADAFGTYLSELVQDLSDVSDADLRSGFAEFNRLNHPWVSLVEPPNLEQALSELLRFDPSLLLSSHGVLAHGRTGTLTEALIEICTMEPFVAPDQAAFEALKADMGGG
jgi:flavorubredoxin